MRFMLSLLLLNVPVYCFLMTPGKSSYVILKHFQPSCNKKKKQIYSGEQEAAAARNSAVRLLNRNSEQEIKQLFFPSEYSRKYCQGCNTLFAVLLHTVQY